jgi:hypothetical protein
MEADQRPRLERVVVIPKVFGWKRTFAMGLALAGIVLPGGEVRYDIFPSDNRNSVVFAPGGIHPSGALVSGELSTMPDVRGTKSLFQLLVSRICSGFVKIKSFHLGQEALALLEKGTRLTMDVEASPISDLRLENDYCVG